MEQKLKVLLELDQQIITCLWWKVYENQIWLRWLFTSKKTPTQFYDMIIVQALSTSFPRWLFYELAG